jgi:hypothetical protein
MGLPGGNWYLRSIGDRDTHCGELQSDGSVLGRCGVEFRARPLPYGRIALPYYPADPEQICPQCRESKPANRGVVR